MQNRLVGLMLITPLAAALLLLPRLLRAEQPLSVRAEIEKREAYVGEPIALNIIVSGDSSPKEPELSGIDGFSVTAKGGRQNSSSSITIINGRLSQKEERGYIFSYQLTPLKTGRLSIPPLEVSIGGRRLMTQPLTVDVSQPQPDDDFKLELDLSDARAYAGQPVTLTVSWYFARNVEDYSFSLPLMNDRRFLVQPIELPGAPSGTDSLILSVGSSQIPARKFDRAKNGRSYAVVQFQLALVPRESGSLELPQASVTGGAIAGYSRSRSPFGDFFDDGFLPDDLLPGFGRQPIRKRFAAASNQPVLEVSPLPAEGRPADFSGLVGSYSLLANASPTEARVGDPITLTVEIAGPDYMGAVSLPALHKQEALTRDFKVPQDMSPPEIKRGVARFVQTIRPLHAGVTAIPPIRLPYFNSETGRYETALSDPIPLRVSAARVVTAADAEGRTFSPSEKRKPQEAAGGIAHNYEGAEVLSSQPPEKSMRAFSSALIRGSPAVFLLCLCLAGVKRFGRLWAGRRPHYRELEKAVRVASGEPELLQALRRYLAQRFDLPPGAAAYSDLENSLNERKISAAVKEQLKCLLGRLEESCYGGGKDSAGNSGPELLAIVRELEEQLR